MRHLGLIHHRRTRARRHRNDADVAQSPPATCGRACLKCEQAVATVVSVVVIRLIASAQLYSNLAASQASKAHPLGPNGAAIWNPLERARRGAAMIRSGGAAPEDFGEAARIRITSSLERPPRTQFHFCWPADRPTDRRRVPTSCSSEHAEAPKPGQVLATRARLVSPLPTHEMDMPADALEAP